MKTPNFRLGSAPRRVHRAVTGSLVLPNFSSPLRDLMAGRRSMRGPGKSTHKTGRPRISAAKVVGTNNVVTNTASAQRFYRLVKP